MSRKHDQRKGDEAREQLKYEQEKRQSWPGIVTAAWNGDVESARQAIHMVVTLLPDSPTAIPPEVREFMSGCLLDILNGDDPAQAMCLKRRKYQPPPTDFWKLQRDSGLADLVAIRMRGGMTFDEAAREAAKEYDAYAKKAGKVGEESARKAYLRFFPKDSGKR